MLQEVSQHGPIKELQYPAISALLYRGRFQAASSQILYM
jgi:hypothetical protein